MGDSTGLNIMESVVLKVTSDGRTFRKLRVSRTAPSWLDFSTKVCTSCKVDPPVRLFYCDDDGDSVVVDTADELTDAVSVASVTPGGLRMGVGSPNDANFERILSALMPGYAASSVAPSRNDSIQVGNEDSTASSRLPGAPAGRLEEEWQNVDNYPAVPTATSVVSAEDAVPPGYNPPSYPSLDFASAPLLQTHAPESSNTKAPLEPSSLPELEAAPERHLPQEMPAAKGQPTDSEAAKEHLGTPSNTESSKEKGQGNDSTPVGSMKQSFDTLAATIQGILAQHPELFEQFNVLMNQILEQMSTHCRNLQGHCSTMWEQFSQACQDYQEEAKEKQEREAETGTKRARRSGCWKDRKRSERGFGGSSRHPCGGNFGHKDGFPWGGVPWFAPFGPFGGQSCQRPSGAQGSSNEKPGAHGRQNQSDGGSQLPREGSQEYPGTYPSSRDDHMSNLDELIARIQNMGFTTPTHELAVLLTRYDRNVNRVVDILLRDN